MIWFLFFCVYDEPSADCACTRICIWRMYIIELLSEMVYKVYKSSRSQLLDCGERRSARGRLCGGFRKRIGVKSIVQDIPMSL